MSPDHRRFFGKYYLLTILVPAYITAAAHYGLAWLLFYLTPPQVATFSLIIPVALLIFCLLLTPLQAVWMNLTRIGFQLTGVPGSSEDPGPEEARILDSALKLIHDQLDFSTGLKTHIVKTGGAPFLAINDGNPRRLWISREMVHAFETPVLTCLLAHEVGHIAARTPRSHLVLQMASWLPAFCLAVILQDFPWLFVAFGLIQTLVWLRIQLWTTMELERQADQTASGLMGRDNYIAAFMDCYRYVSGNGNSKNVRIRLAGMDVPPGEIESLLAEQIPPAANDH